MKLNVKAFGLACGITWGIGVCFLTWWLIFFEGPGGDPGLLGRIYLGWTLTPLGSLWGLLLGFLDGLIGGIFFAWLYNYISALR